MFTTKTWVLLGLIAAALFFTPRSSAQSISCSSDDGRRHYCPADTRGGVQLAKQRSDSPCNQGYSWGFDRGGIWVDRGCRADFIVNAYLGGSQYDNQYQGGSSTISCSSDDGGRHYCPVDARGRVRLANQRSESACREGYSWGRDGRGIWVDHGCRADFTIDADRGGWDRDRDGDRDRDRDRDQDRGDADQIISCASDDMHRHYCPADTRGGVQLLKQRSDSACRQGYSWGYSRRGIWVDHGCRADFQLIR